MTDQVFCNSCGAIDRPAFDGEDDYCANCGRGNVEPVEDINDEYERVIK